MQILLASVLACFLPVDVKATIIDPEVKPSAIQILCILETTHIHSQSFTNAIISLGRTLSVHQTPPRLHLQ